jgi:hypothetical protein
VSYAGITARMGGVVDDVRAERQSLELRRVLLTLLFAVPLAVGWVAGGVWAVLAWTWAAFVVGFRAAAGSGKDTPA